MTRQSYATLWVLTVFLTLAASHAGIWGATYRNPVIEGNLADPAVILHEGVYYLYATGDVDGDNGYRAYTSKNLVDWERGPVVFRPGQRHVWAPDLWRDPTSGRFFLYYTASQTVGVAEGEGPLGPFTIRRKLFDRAIDAHLFQDDDGRLYLYYVQLPGFRIMVQPMAGPTEPAGEPRLVLRPESDWEKRAGHVTEGPWLIKHRDRYYMLYSGSGADTPDYAVGYATADHPLGPFTRAAHNPIVHRADGLFGPGHGCAIRDGAGHWWHIYHQKRNDRVEWNRFICIDPLRFDEDGNLFGQATRGTPQPAPTPALQGDKPNIVLIISDDQAWGDYGFMGHPHIETPHLDRLAQEGLTFTRSYGVAPLCRPSLASMVTGLHPHQHGIVGNDPPLPAAARPRDKGWLVPRAQVNEHLVRRIELVPTLPRMLAEQGYVSLQTGKWWEGTPARGGFTEGMTHGDPTRGGRHGDAGLTIGRQGLGAITNFIERARAEDRPFFIWYAPFLPHAPHTPPERLEQKYLPKAPTPAVAKYWAMCEWFDETCGELLAYLDQKGLRENTIVAYVCDNGWIQDPNRPNVFAPRSKQSPYEGGLRTPIMIRWPARLQPRFDRQTLVSSIDLAPTLLKACGLKPTPAMHGVDLLDAPALASRSSIYAAAYEHDIVDINRPAESLKYRVVVNGPKKLILPNPARLPHAQVELYDVVADPHEQKDLAAAEPQTVQRLSEALDRWWIPPTPGLQEIEDPRVRRYVIPQRVVWQSPGATVENPQALLSAGRGQVTLDNTNPCVLHEGGGVLVDFGRQLHGGVQILIGRMKDQSPARLRLRFGESVSEAMSDLGGARNATNDHAVRDQSVLAPWLGTLEIGPTGFRFVRLDLEDKGRAVPLVGLRAVSIMRDLEYKGSFRCSDERLNRIWQTGAYTVHLNMQDYLWDGIKRDRLVWVGDMHPETRTILAVFGGHDIVPRSLDLIRDETPLPKWMNGISSYSLWWVLLHHEWYRYTADRAYLRQQRDYLIPLLQQLCTCLDAKDREKLPEVRFLDWPSRADKQATHAGLHALLVLTLDAGAELCGVLQERDQARQCRAAASRLRRYVPDPGPSKQAAALMALAGLRDARQLNEQVLAVGGAARMSTFYGYYVLQARAQAGDTQGCLDCIRSYWGAMLDLGATSFWEDFDLAWTENAARIDELVPAGKKDIHGDFGNYCYQGFRHSLCHGWASGPTAWLSEHVLGIRLLESGGRTIRIAPQLGDLDWAEGTFPIRQGLVRVWHARQPDGSIKSGFTVPDGVEVVR